MTATLLNEHGLPVPKFAAFSRFAYPEALQSFREFPKPVVVKPQLGVRDLETRNTPAFYKHQKPW